MKKNTLYLVLMLLGITINAQIIPDDGMVASYPFNGNANDESGNGNDGNVIGAILTTDRSGNQNSAYIFDGVNDYIDCGVDPIGNNSSFSISLWFYPTSKNDDTADLLLNGDPKNQYIISSGGQSSLSVGYALVWNNGYVRFLRHTDNELFDTEYDGIYEDNNWHHFVGTYSTSEHTISAYVDGNLVDCVEGTDSIFNNVFNKLTVGKPNEAYHNYFQGKVDDIVIYNRVLDEMEIKGLYSEISVKPSLTEAIVGNTIEISIVCNKLLSEEDNIISYQFDFNFDNTKLEFVEASLNETMAEGGEIEINTDKTNSISVGYMTSTALTGAGDLIKLKFRAIGRGSSNLDIQNFYFNSMPVTYISNSSLIVINSYGDVDANGKVMAYDAALTLQYSVGLDPLPSIDPLPWEDWRKIVADVDQTSGITANDAAEILKYSVGKITQFPVENENKNGSIENADVNLEVKNNEIIFKASGELYGLNIVTQNTSGLENPIVLDSDMLIATNITDSIYAIGICTAYSLNENETFLKIPYTNEESVTFELVVNQTYKTVTVDLISGISMIDSDIISIFPNPVENVLNINGLSTNLAVKIYNITGGVVFEKKNVNNSINISELAKGTYLIQLYNHNELLFSKKILKN